MRRSNYESKIKKQYNHSSIKMAIAYETPTEDVEDTLVTLAPLGFPVVYTKERGLWLPDTQLAGYISGKKTDQSLTIDIPKRGTYETLIVDSSNVAVYFGTESNERTVARLLKISEHPFLAIGVAERYACAKLAELPEEERVAMYIEAKLARDGIAVKHKLAEKSQRMYDGIVDCVEEALEREIAGQDVADLVLRLKRLYL